MGWLIGTVLAISGVTALAAWFIVRRNPTGSSSSQIMFAVASFPVLSGLFAAVVIAGEIAKLTPQDHRGSFGMAIFAVVVFWFYGLVASVIVGVPTAVVAVGRFRGG
ncbi:hypothetical protein [Sphingomonas radiodurans]|uniref:hypothetical protein n=1 Tax=Sphingomonas radiodurans TaxID=2890321 RepID=UPI001E57CF7E|nr:hypothetical protein [Sphingomonas radiodurans]WBH15981.1 hypothetical protein LLW23_14395 [Sphingomonas radiodurans]